MPENEPIQLSAMPTPNPNTIKFLPNMSFFEKGTVNFPNRENKESSVLVTALFEIEELEGVMIGNNFISVAVTITFRLIRRFITDSLDHLCFRLIHSGSKIRNLLSL